MMQVLLRCASEACGAASIISHCLLTWACFANCAHLSIPLSAYGRCVCAVVHNSSHLLACPGLSSIAWELVCWGGGEEGAIAALLPGTELGSPLYPLHFGGQCSYVGAIF